MEAYPSFEDPKLGSGLDWAITALLDYKEELDYDSQHFNRGELEANMWDGFFGYVRTGLSLKSMAYYQRYKKECKTFKQYCERFLHISEGYAKKIMEATDVWLNLVAIGFKVLPNCVSQAIPLIKYNVVDEYGDSPLGGKWQECLDYATRINKKRVTSTLVKEVVDGKEKPRRMEVDKDLWDIIDNASAEAGISKKEFVRRAIENYLHRGAPAADRSEGAPDAEEKSPVNPEAQQAWEKDLQELVEEHKLENSAPAQEDCLEEPASMDISPVPVSPPPAIEQQSKLAISFGKTLQPLLRGMKTVTRRCWKLREVQKFGLAFERGQWVRALDKAYFCGGKQIGWVRLIKPPYQEELSEVSQRDCDLEGYPELSPRQFLNRFFGGKGDRTVWVLEFEFLRC